MSAGWIKWNVHKHGHEAVAGSVLRKLGHDGGTVALYIDESGASRVRNLRASLGDARPDRELVGVYTKAAEINRIEDDILEHLRQTNAARAA